MSSVKHRLTGSVLTFVLEEEVRTVRTQLESTDRTGRTLVKNGPLRITLAGLAPGGAMAAHKADGPISVQVLEGSLTFEAENEKWTLNAGSMLALQSRIVHSVRSESGAIFILTVVAPADDNAGAPPPAAGR